MRHMTEACSPNQIPLLAGQKSPEVGLASVIGGEERLQGILQPFCFVVGPFGGFGNRDDEPTAAAEFARMKHVHVERCLNLSSGVGSDDVFGRTLADRKKNVCADSTEFGVEKLLAVGVGSRRWFAVCDTEMQIRTKQILDFWTIRFGCIEQTDRTEHMEKTTAGGVREGYARFAAAVDAGVVANDVKIGVGVAVARNELFAERGHPKWIARAVGDVLHDGFQDPTDKILVIRT